jgi:hypothetical protein
MDEETRQTEHRLRSALEREPRVSTSCRSQGSFQQLKLLAAPRAPTGPRRPLALPRLESVHYRSLTFERVGERRALLSALSYIGRKG